MGRDNAYARVHAYVTVADTHAITMETKQNKTKKGHHVLKHLTLGQYFPLNKIKNSSLCSLHEISHF
jgi:hypothetical protein